MSDPSESESDAAPNRIAGRRFAAIGRWQFATASRAVELVRPAWEDFGVATPDIVRAHRHSIRHRDEVLASERCGCFFCCAVFPPSDVADWTDEWEGVGQTALCPRCGIDSVIGSESGYPLTPEFLAAMQAQWF